MDYYGINHFMGREKAIRAILEHVTTPLSAFFYYPISLLKHLGRYDLAVIGSIIVTTCYLSYQPKKTNLFTFPSSFKSTILTCVLLLFFVPIFILYLDNLKSPIVASIVICPLLWIVSWPVIGSHQYVFSKNITYFLNYSAIGILLIGLFFYCFNMSINKHHTEYYSDAVMIKKMNLDIGDYATKKKWPMIYMSIDGIYPAICSGSLISQYFESKKIALQAAPQKMGGIIFPITLQEALDSIKSSNLVIITPDQISDSPYPLTASIQPLKPLLLKEIGKLFILLNTYNIEGHPYQVYVKG